jgi:hypothetical protein
VIVAVAHLAPAPAEHHELAAAVLDPHNGRQLGRRLVVALLELRRLGRRPAIITASTAAAPR